MNTRIARLMTMGTALVGLAAMAPAVDAQDRDWDRRNDRADLHQDYDRVARINNDIRRDQYRLQDDREDGRYRQADCERYDLHRDYVARNNQIRDIHHDQRDLRHDRW